MQKPETLREAYVRASSFLLMRGVGDARSCAELLLQHLFGWTRSQLLLHWSEPFPEELEDAWQRLIERKAFGEPVQYIVGEQSFYGLPFRVTPAVLIPRPETELLVEAVVQRVRELWPEAVAGTNETGGQGGGQTDAGRASGNRGDSERRRQGPTIVDIGTGSGAIAVTLAKQLPGSSVIATDLSAEALEVARLNAEHNGVAARIEWRQGDLLEPLIETRVAEIDVLISNPPYIREDELPELQPEVKYYEPKLALLGGKDGLDCYRKLTGGLRSLPRLPRLVAFEVGQGQASDVERLLRDVQDWRRIEIVKDLAGIERHVVAIG